MNRLPIIIAISISFLSLSVGGQNKYGMTLIREFISPDKNAPVIVLFGGNPDRMNEVVTIIRDSLKRVTAVGNFSEEEGLTRLDNIKKVDLVLIGGRYTDAQRIRIRNYLKQHFPAVATTEPGYQYPYDNSEILRDIKKKLQF